MPSTAPFFWKIHRFTDDQELGEIMGRMRMGTDTIKDRIEINKHYHGTSDRITLALDTTTACVKNTERNAITFMAWKNYTAQNHPSSHNNELPLDKVIFIECLIETGKCRASNVIHDIAHSRLGNDDIREVSGKKSGGGGGGKTVTSHALLPWIASHGQHKQISKREKVGNGMQCKCKRVKLKSGTRPTWKTWDNHRVYTVSVEDVEFVEFEHCPGPPKGATKHFSLNTESFWQQ